MSLFWYTTKPNTIPTLDPYISNNKALIIAGIRKQHQEGHHVILSIGGATDKEEIPSYM